MAFVGTIGYYRVKTLTHRRDQQHHDRQVMSLNHEIDTLLAANRELETRLAPFERLAKWKYRKSPVQNSLETLRVDLEKARAHAEEVEYERGPRTLRGGAIATVVSAVRRFPGQRIQLMSSQGNEEANRFATQLASVIAEGGWIVENNTQEVFAQPAVGLILMVGTKPPPPAAESLGMALRKEGFEVAGQLNYGLGDGRIRLIVGAKP